MVTRTTEPQKEAVCGVCDGFGRVRQWNGFEKWEEVCYQCRGKGKVVVK